jgi:hypothetical protein
MKPFWGACTWEFQKSGVEVPTAIQNIQQDQRNTATYDLNGRKVNTFQQPGVYIKNGTKVVVQ